MRGTLTKRIQSRAISTLGREITTKELRLYPYIQNVMMNEQKLDIRRISPEEREILSQLRKAGFIEGGASEMTITKTFWEYINEVLWYAYVLQEDEEVVDSVPSEQKEKK